MTRAAAAVEGARWRRRQVVAAAILTTGCVTTITDEAAQPAPRLDLAPVVIPLGGADSGPPIAVEQYYSSVLAQLREAVVERDLDRMVALLASHERSGAPAWARDRLRGFRAAAAGLAVAQHLERTARVVAAAELGPLGRPVPLKLVLGGAPAVDGRVEIGGESGSVAFLVDVAVTDTDAAGSRALRRTSEILRLAARTALSAAAQIELPFAVDVAAGAAVTRAIEVGVTLVPGNALVDDVACPVTNAVDWQGRRVPFATFAAMQYPAGVEPIRAQPLRTLQRALELGDAAHYPHQYLASLFMPQDDREAALGLLVDRVRLGSAAQARVAMACLRVLTGEPHAVGDRTAWLRWWLNRSERSR